MTAALILQMKLKDLYIDLGNRDRDPQFSSFILRIFKSLSVQKMKILQQVESEIRYIGNTLVLGKKIVFDRNQGTLDSYWC